MRTNVALRSTSQRSQNQQVNNSMSFSDISKLALQIKDILPHASYELIQRHIYAAPTLDIDTVLASILDDEMGQTTRYNQVERIHARPRRRQLKKFTY